MYRSIKISSSVSDKTKNCCPNTTSSQLILNPERWRHCCSSSLSLSGLQWYPFPYLIAVFIKVVHTFPNLLVARSFGYNLKLLVLRYHWFCSHPTFLMVDRHSLFFSLLCGQYTCKPITISKVIVIVPENTCIFQN